MMKKLLCTLTLLFFAIGATQAQNITISGLGTTIAGDGSNSPLIIDDTQYGSVDIASGSVVHTFTITNITATDLVILGSNPLSGVNPTDFVKSNPGSTTIAAGASTTFTVEFNPNGPPGLKSAIVTFNTLSIPSFLPQTYTFNIGGTATASLTPNIDISGLGNSISNLDFSPSITDDTRFGDVTVGNSLTHTFTITNTGTAPLNLTGAPLVNIIGGGAAFSVTNFPTTPVPVSGSTTFDVTFTPSSVNNFVAQILVGSDDPADPNYLFSIDGDGISLTPEIAVSGLGNPIANFDVSPSPLDDTSFGNVAIGNNLVHTFTITNTGTAPLNLTGVPLVNIVGGGGEFVVTNLPTTPIPVSGSTTFDVTYTAATLGNNTAQVVIPSDDITDPNFLFSIDGTGVNLGPEMDVTGLGSPINDGDLTTNVTNDTDYGSVDVSTGSVTHVFTIQNSGTLDLTLTDPSPYVTISGTDAADFTLVTIPSSLIAAAGSTTFSITFDPTGTALTTRNATVSIANDDADENPYTFAISGTAIDANTGSPLMITQYYEGAGNDQWIEVKNISTQTITAGIYNLALYTNTGTRDGVINTTAPVQSVGISGAGGAILPGEVILFQNNIGGGTPALPLGANLGSAHIIPTTVCNFTGNDVILISTSTGTNCYNDRIDIVGVIPPPSGFPPNWGLNKSLIKGCGTTQQPSLVFDENDFIELFIDEVNTADSQTNMALGTQVIGSTTWTSSWSNGTPDRTRNAIISGTYNATDGSFGACDLNVLGNLNFNSSTSNYVEVNDNLSISGTFTIGDQESLYSVNVLDPGGDPVSVTGTITKLETTTSLNDSDDYTYWSSPVESANMSTVFAPGTYQQTRLYYWDQSVPNVIPNGGSEALGEWISATGLTMRPGKGYISQSPEAGTYPLQATVSFSGTPNNGTIDLDASGNDVIFNNNGDGNDDLNLVGNPYPSAIDADEFISDGNNAVSINGTLWFWTHNTPNNQNPTGEQYTSDDYAPYNLLGSLAGAPAVSGGVAPNGIIGSGQGFMVQTNSTIQKVSFTDGMRVKGNNTQFFRGVDIKKATTEEKDRIWLNAESSEGGAFSQILVGFVDDATDGFDRVYDGIKLSEGWVNLYSKIDTLKYGIQGLGSFNLDRKVPLAFQTYIEDVDVTYSINIDRFEGESLRDNDIYLVDNDLNVTHDLKQGAYSFSAATGSHDDRFTLQFTKSTLDVDDLELNNDFVVVNEENTLLVKSKSIVSELKMYDITGRLLLNMLPNETEFRIKTDNIRKGTVLILNTTFENGTELSKKAIKY